MAVMLAYETDVFPTVNSSESLVTPAPPAPLQRFIQIVITSQNSDSMPVTSVQLLVRPS